MTSQGLLVRVGLAAVALATLVGCGARSSAATVGGTRSAAPAPGSITATRSGVAIDRRIVRFAQLRQSDFPSGWTSGPAPAATTGARCPAVRGAKAAVSARARSREFTHGSTATADGAIYVYADTATAADWFVRLSSRATTACLVRALRPSLESQIRAQGGTIDSITAPAMTIRPVGNQHAAHLVIVRVTAGTVRATAYADLIFVRVGRALAAFSLGRVNLIFDTGLEAGLASAVTGRLAAGLRLASVSGVG